MPSIINIDILRNLNVSEFVKRLSSNENDIETGSASACCAAMAAALFKKALTLESLNNKGDYDFSYLLRNSEKLVSYMLFLIDEDVKCRGPLRRAYKEDSNAIAACCNPACEINSEIISMMYSLLQFCKVFAEDFGKTSVNFHYVYEASCLAMSSIDASISFINSILPLSDDETFIYVTKRENEIIYSECIELMKYLAI